MTTYLFSGAARIHEKCQKIKPMNKKQRQKAYSSCQLTANTKNEGIRKYSPFSTVSRTKRDSYLLRVTKETNTQTNYELNFSPLLKKEKRPTIDQAKFQRIIGPVNNKNFSVQFDPKRGPKCAKSFSRHSKSKPLTIRQTHKWRKTAENLDFKKQIDPKRSRSTNFITSKSAQNSLLLKDQPDTTESNFDNYKRFSFVSHPEKSHDFKSDFPHKYLQAVYKREIEPEYDVTKNKEDFCRVSMKKPQGQMRFDLNREQVTTRVDRADPHWFQNLDYSTQNKQIECGFKTISFNLTTNRKPNQVYSKYPIRQSMQAFTPLNEAK